MYVCMYVCVYVCWLPFFSAVTQPWSFIITTYMQDDGAGTHAVAPLVDCRLALCMYVCLCDGMCACACLVCELLYGLVDIGGHPFQVCLNR